jgi:hypothetical protein
MISITLARGTTIDPPDYPMPLIVLMRITPDQHQLFITVYFVFLIYLTVIQHMLSHCFILSVEFAPAPVRQPQERGG